MSHFNEVLAFQKPNSEKIKMVKKQSLRELLRDERISHAANCSVLYGIDQILLRATQNKDLGMMENVMKIFQEKVSPFYTGMGGDGNGHGDINGFWEDISGLFKYDFGDLEKHCLKQPLENGALHFMRKLYSAYEEKFYQDSNDLDSIMVDFSGIIDSIDEMVLSKKYSVNN